MFCRITRLNARDILILVIWYINSSASGARISISHLAGGYVVEEFAGPGIIGQLDEAAYAFDLRGTISAHSPVRNAAIFAPNLSVAARSGSSARWA